MVGQAVDVHGAEGAIREPCPPEREHTMSQHSSLKGGSKIAIKRNVLKRFERVAILKKRGQWKEGERIMGMRKTKPDV